MDRRELELLDDNATVEDSLDFAQAARILVDAICTAPTLPFTVGTFGEWGSGKTSLMRMVEKGLRERHVKTVWFNAWKYDGKEVLWNALIQTIFFEMKNDPEVAARERAAEFRRKVARAATAFATYAAKIGTRFVPGGIVREEDVDALVAAVRSSAADDLFEFVNRFEEVFRELVVEYTGNDRFLVVFIDDLDRCLPDNAITVLEALKLYLDQSRCVFFVGIDPRTVEAGISQKYGDNPHLSAREYLEKIVQLPFVVPRPAKKLAFAQLYGEGRPLPPGQEDKQLVDMVRRATNRNPRRIKRFINAFMVASMISGKELTADDRRALAKVLLIQQRFPAFYRLLATRANTIEKLQSAIAPDAEAARRDEFREFIDDPELMRFLEKTKRFAVRRAEVGPWVRLTRGVPSTELADADDAEEPEEVAAPPASDGGDEDKA